MQIRFSNDAAHIQSHRLHVQKILPLWHSAVTLFSFYQFHLQQAQSIGPFQDTSDKGHFHFEKQNVCQINIKFTILDLY